MVLCHASSLVAQAGPYTHLARRFQPGGGSFGLIDAAVWLLLIAGAVTIAWFVYRLYNQVTQRQQRSPAWLFHELCATHALTWSDKQLLRWLARVHNLPHPSYLFLQPHRFDSHALPPDAAALSNQVARLRERLFGVSHVT
jgi:hypothetical protein